MKTTIITTLLCITALLAGCASPGQRAALITAGGAAGGAIGYAASDKDPVVTAAAAAAGAGLSALAMGKDAQAEQEGFDLGYIQGQSDAIKRQYWLRQALEQEKKGESEAGRRVYIAVPGPEQTADGRKLEPHVVSVPIVE